MKKGCPVAIDLLFAVAYVMGNDPFTRALR